MFVDGCANQLSHDFRHRILCSDLDDARTKRVSDREDIAEVQIMREDDKTMLACIGHDHSIQRSRIAQ